MIDKAIVNQSPAAKIFGCWWKDTALNPFKFANGEGATSAMKTRAKGRLRLGAPISFARLAGIPIKSASGASANRRKRKTPKGISDAESAFEVGRANRLLRFFSLPRFGGGFFGIALRIHIRVHRFPAASPHQHAVGVLDGIHMAVVVFDHFDRGAHLFGQDIHVHAFA